MTPRTWATGLAVWLFVQGLTTALGQPLVPGEAEPPPPPPPPATAHEPPAAVKEPERPSAGERTFLEAWSRTRDEFHDPKMNGVDWEAVRDELLPRARAADTPEAVSAVINDALDRLRASHTRHFHLGQREYYEVTDVFERRGGGRPRRNAVSYIGVGMVTTVIDGKVFASDVYNGGPADKAGILVGDELVSVNGGPWGDVAPFRKHAGEELPVVIQRTADPSSRQTLKVEPARIQPFDLFLAAEKRSVRVIEHDGKQIAYIRLRSYAHEAYHEALKEQLSTTLATADALVLDLRGGWGGAVPEYMDIFNPVTPTVEFTGRDGNTGSNFAGWRKPVLMLVDHGTRSGKEILAYAFKQGKVGRIVGERTAGAVLGGRLFPLKDGSALLIAVAGVKTNGAVLEGVGVEPDVIVTRPIPYCAGADPQLDAAVREAVGMVK